MEVFNTCGKEHMKLKKEMVFIDVFPNIDCEGFILNHLENKNSLAYGTLGQYLACNYIFNKKFDMENFGDYIADYRTNSFFWGHSGLLYFLTLNNANTSEVLLMILKNMSYEDLSLATGVAGVGISLLYYYSKCQDNTIIEIIERIRAELMSEKITQCDNSLENGKLGATLFYIYDYFVFHEEQSLNKAVEYINQVVDELEGSNYQKILLKNSDSDYYEYYISNGICGLIAVMVEFSVKTKSEFFIEKIEYFTRICFGIYSISPSFFTGTAGFLYVFFKVLKNIKLSASFEEALRSQINYFYLDIKNTMKDEMIYDADASNHKKHFFGGKEGIVTVLDMINQNKTKPIFPFII